MPYKRGDLAQRRRVLSNNANFELYDVKMHQGAKYEFKHRRTNNKKVVVGLSNAEAFMEGLEFASHCQSPESNLGHNFTKEENL